MSDLEMRFLGDFAIKVGGEPVITLNKPRLQSLLAYLILHRDAPQFRYHLAGMLWPDSPETQAHTNLRNLVYLLKKALPGSDRLILSDAQTLQWNPQASFRLDVLDFQQIAYGSSLQTVPLEKLETAVQLYQGDLLPSCYEEWVFAEREHYRQVFIALLDHLIDRYESLRRYEDAIAGCQRLVTAEPFHKDGYPRLMRLFALNVEVPLALKTYQDYVRLLKSELGIEPPSEMQDLYAHLKRTAGQVRPSGGYQVFPPPLLPLVGRSVEWQAIQSLWKTTAGGNAHMLIICGEAGIGKTRLVEEQAGWAQRQGIRTAMAHCFPSEGALPYAPVVEWLRVLQLPPLGRVWKIELSRLLPELLEKNAAPPAPLSEAWQRLRLFEALARAALGGHQKTLLIVEDLHWCDSDTLEWLHYLLRFDPHAPLLVVGTVRSEEADANPAYDRLLSVTRQEGTSLEIELGPLNEIETGQLAAGVAGKTLESGVGPLLYQETEGNPLFIVETVRAELFKQARLPGLQPLPYKAQAVLENRIRQLSPVTREMAQLAATIGRAFSLEILRRASSSIEVNLIKSLDEMLQRRIVREIAQNTFDFSHDKLRQAALVEISGPHRQMLHRQVAEALVSLAEGKLESQGGEIASHYEQAGRLELAVQYYQIAAESARKIFANDLAVQYFQRAISLGELPPSNASSQTISSDQLALLYEKMGEILAIVGKYPQAQVSLERALAQPFGSSALWRSQLYRKICETMVPQYLDLQAHAALDQAEQALNLSNREGMLPERQEWIQIQLTRSDLYYWKNQPDQIDAILQKILPIVEAEGRPDQYSEMLSQQLMARFRHERYRLSNETLEIARHKLDFANKLVAPLEISTAMWLLGFSLLWHGEPLAARDWLAKAYEAAGRLDARLLQERSLSFLSLASRQLGDITATRQQSAALFALASEMGRKNSLGTSQANLGWLAWRDGDLALAEELCNSANEIWKHSGEVVMRWPADWVLLAIAVSRRDLDRAKDRARALLDSNLQIQPILEPVAEQLEEALRACREKDSESAFQYFNQALELVKACGDL
jgi:DNA-binding SARP family transcriptional activator